MKCIYFAITTQYAPSVRSPLGSSRGRGSCLQARTSSKELKRWKVKLIWRVSCSAEVLWPVEPLPVTHPSLIHPQSCPPLQLRPWTQYCWPPTTLPLPGSWTRAFSRPHPLWTFKANKIGWRKPTEPPLEEYAEKRRQKKTGKTPYPWIYMAQWYLSQTYCNQAVQNLSDGSFLLLVHQGENQKPEHSKGRDRSQEL